MKRLFALTILLATIGCSHESTISSSTAQNAIEKETASVDLAPSATTEAPEDTSYPEKADVMRLLVRASSLESKGEFADAFALADQAVSIDPNSPKANAMKARLEELLRRA